MRAYASLLRFAALLALFAALSVPVRAAALPEADYARLSEAARAFYESHFSEAKHYQALMAFYRTVIQDYKRHESQ